MVVAALKALADLGELEVAVVTAAMKKFGISGDKVNPLQM
jgi:pyruvate dehydrogenase complex dehydrogenase (E1) component